VDREIVGWHWDNSYARLPGAFFRSVAPTPVHAPRLVILNEELCAELGLDAAVLQGDLGAQVFSGNLLPPGAQPIAQAYAGHQFGSFTFLGDGRAVVLGEHITPRGDRVDIALKGSGPTPFSRRGDGRAALGPMLREYVVSEAMHALGIPTTRSLAVVATGEEVLRERFLPGAVLTRVARSHIRVGTFQYFWARGALDLLGQLADYTLWRHFPSISKDPSPYRQLLRAVVDQQARLVASWMLVGFIHGVMNTDNMSLAGETIDYGPCAFMDTYRPETVYSSIDTEGRYAFANQPVIAGWNLTRFAETLLPLMHPDRSTAEAWAREELEGYPRIFRAVWLEGMFRKLGVIGAGDVGIVQDWLGLLERSGADYTNAFRHLAADNLPAAPPFTHPEFPAWHARWQGAIAAQEGGMAAARQRMLATNPAVIPRNHRVEEVLAAAQEGDMEPLQRFLAVLRHPYSDPADPQWQEPPSLYFQQTYRTFCGT
jgi:uncharacterized protein YdiU (UPF0061 family)